MDGIRMIGDVGGSSRPTVDTARTRSLDVKQLSDLGIPVKLQGASVTIERSERGKRLRQPVVIQLDSLLQVGQIGLANYIISSLSAERPKLIPFVLANKSLVEMARYFLRYRSGSSQTLYHYADTISRYSAFSGMTPDELVNDLKDRKGRFDQGKIQVHVRMLEDYIGKLQDDGLSPSRVHGYAKAIKTLYRVNGARVELPYPLSRRIIYKDRAPKPEELARLLDIAGLRERLIISAFALGGFREETLSRLEFRHVKEDIEQGTVPIHIHVEASITKGKYHDYDTFLQQEAAEYLRLYIEQRRKGSVDGKIPPEILTDSSPLIRNEKSAKPAPVTSKQIRKLVHNLYFKAGLIKPSLGRRYDLRVHSIRKFFKTQMEALGVKTDYTEYMMGHTIDTYHDIQSLGIDRLRGIYAASGISIRPKTRIGKIDALKEIIRAWGMNPEEVLTRGAMSQGDAAKHNAENYEEIQLQVLGRTLRELVRKEVTES